MRGKNLSEVSLYWYIGHQHRPTQKIRMKPSKYDSKELEAAYKEKRRQVKTAKYDFPISTIYDKIVKEGQIRLDPEYQRGFVWDQDKSSQLIESILLGIPLPTIYLSEDSEGDETIDGKQRLTTITSFINGTYPSGEPFVLRGLKELSMLNGARYRDLPKSLKKDFGFFQLSIIQISEDSHEDAKFDIFERLNKGSAKLKEQEIRNCIYRGPLNTALKELVQSDRFKRLFNFPEKQSSRMEDAGFVIYFLTIADGNGTMRGDPKTAINKYMKRNQNMPDDEIKKNISQFMGIAETVFTLFGENSFRKFHSLPADSKRMKSQWETRINTALSISMMCAVSQFVKHSIVVNAEAIREKILDLMTLDHDFISSMQSQTTSEKHTSLRTEKIKAAIEECIQPQGPRLFKFEIKEQLFKANPECKLCSQRIFHIDDSHVDHIVRWADGGTTDISNGQLTHRLCNFKKG